MIRHLLLLLTFAATFSGHAQEKQTSRKRKADRAYNAMAYMEAKQAYERLLKDSTDRQVVFRLGECYYKLNQWEQAEKLLEKAVGFKDVPPRYIIMYADALRTSGKDSLSHVWMQKFRQVKVGDLRAMNYPPDYEDYKKLSIPRPHAQVQEATFNAPGPDMAPVVFQEQLVFSSARIIKPTARQVSNTLDDNPFLRLYTIDLKNYKGVGEVRLFDPKLTSRFHEGPVCFNATFDQMYLTRNSENHRQSKKKGDGINRLKLYKSRFTAEGWSEPELLPFNGDDFSTGQPFLTKDGRRLYFVSDRPESYGGTDIFYVDIKDDGSYGRVTNLGNHINTEGNEMFPFIDKYGILYFSSDGHVTLGRMDIFYSQIKNNGTFSKVYNIGAPINSPYDDFSLIFKDGILIRGYFTSNRPGGTGNDDIYAFSLRDPLNKKHYLQGRVKARHTDIEVPNATIIIRRMNGRVADSIRTGVDGSFKIDIDPDDQYSIEVSAPGFNAHVDKFVMGTEPNKWMPIELDFVPGHKVIVSATDRRLREEISDARVRLVNKKTNEELELLTDKSGRAIFILEGELGTSIDYEVKIEKRGFFMHIGNLLRKYSDKEIQEVNVDLLQPFVEMNFLEYCDISPINFDHKKYYLRNDAKTELNKLVVLLDQFPNMQIEIAAHTDSRGNYAENQTLTEKRAQACAEYLISKGISRERISTTGYGESMLLNHCTDGNYCSERDHLKNNRIDIIVQQVRF